MTRTASPTALAPLLLALALGLTSPSCRDNPPGVVLTIEWVGAATAATVYLSIYAQAGGPSLHDAAYEAARLFEDPEDGSNRVLVIADDGTPSLEVEVSVTDGAGIELDRTTRTVALPEHGLVEATVSLGDVPGADGGADAGTGADSGPGCTWSPFAPPLELAELGTASVEGGPFITADLLRVYFHTNRPGGAGGNDVWMAERSLPSGAFAPPALVGGIATASDEVSPSVTGDDLTIAWESAGDLWLATRATPGGVFPAGAAITSLGAIQLGGPHLSPDGARIYFHADDGSGNLRIFSADGSATTGTFTGATQVVPGSAAPYDVDPSVTADGLTLFFARTEPAEPSRIFMATRAMAAGEFANAALVPGIYDNGLDTGPSISADGTTLVFHTTRTPAPNGSIYVSTRTCD